MKKALIILFLVVSVSSLIAMEDKQEKKSKELKKDQEKHKRSVQECGMFSCMREVVKIGRKKIKRFYGLIKEFDAGLDSDNMHQMWKEFGETNF